jgi:hypothetical protein
MPTSKARSGMAFIMMLSEQPLGMAGVMPTIFGFFSASSTMVCPNTSWYLGGCGLLGTTLMISPVSLLNRPGACHTVGLPASAGRSPCPSR